LTLPSRNRGREHLKCIGESSGKGKLWSPERERSAGGWRGRSLVRTRGGEGISLLVQSGKGQKKKPRPVRGGAMKEERAASDSKIGQRCPLCGVSKGTDDPA